MANLISMVNVCGTSNPPGTKTKLRLAVKGDFAGWPKTREAVVITALGTPAAGDDKILGEPFNFTGAPAGRGYWREYDILIDKGNLTSTLEGELGGQGYKSTIPFTIVGMKAEQLSFADMIVRYSGCLIASISGRNNLDYILGNLDIPVSIESAELALGAANGELSGGNYVLTASTGYTPMIYDSETHGFDLTPNV